ncbi:putative essential subunit of the N-oligosaccharyl transferase (OST) complex which catalyzes the transfer of a high mannose oligosaccharide from a lipid-linked oligosaccharide donor to an asparagine residue within an Asn-X-Ser Thr consensus motif in nascent polypeptide chains [Lyophyllum shimeji]|uniref:Dolichyl-diphosphooligosaccharide--protein glycosyltransferase subunit WBP1 n=1 Tax=Lyophyllum shimeji TaxID=47721 RepID=A0A9P3PGB3_LYOSH|nr:putative essential subunit of the N-oligosaccharyl transferase (OST) complex which catalyzes the transfer of a high mannose oligosaccharide from a lipid-linked oligosaccharide donor to an asparagine residue within an Asn-X-Ser Thr consensus motif in nascent polypeptide chains [Lyophyllum shimeji]
MGFLRSLFFLVAALATSINAKSSTGDSVLVIVEPTQQDNYSLFFDGLREQGYDLTFRAPKAETPVLIEYDVPTFNHVILLAPETKVFARDITPQSLVELLAKKTNLLITLSPKQTPLTSLAAEFALTLPPPGTPLVSYFPEREEPPTVIPVPVPATHPILSPNLHPVWFSGVPHALGNNPLLVPILRAPAESFAAETDGGSADALVDAAERGGEGLWAGSQLGLVTGFQTLDGSRVTWVGGAEVLSDEYARKEISKGVPSGNLQFNRDVAKWTFQETNVLRIDRTEHHRVNETEAREQYTTNDKIVYSAYISKYDPKTSTWVPHSGIKDLQFEFTMLDPHIRTSLPPVPGVPGKYSVTFRAPDRHGVFKFVIDWKRQGFSFLKSSTTVAVVPPRHDEYPRFLSAAWPYYTGAISTSVAFFLFSALWLAGDAREKKAKGHKAE